MSFERRVEVSPGHCWLHEEPSKNYGVAACRVWFYVIGPKGAVQWQIGTDWYPQAALNHLRKFPFSDRDREQPKGWDLGYHAREPHYDGQTSMHDNCQVIGGKCYYDGSTLNAEEWLEGFRNGGTDWLWPRLEQYYRHIFESGEYPDVTPIVRAHPGFKKAV